MKVDIYPLLQSLHIEVVGESGGNLQGRCPVHVQEVGHPDRHPSWYILAETGAWICFSCGAKGSLVDLVTRLLDLSVWDAQSYIQEYGASLDDLEALETPAPKTEPPPPWNAAREFAILDTPPEWALRARHITPEGSAKYDLRWITQEKLWVLPLFHPTTQVLRGWQEKGQKHPWVRNRPVGIRKKEFLFGYREAVKEAASEGSRPVVVVESPLDVVYLAPHLSHMALFVATLGSSVSESQFYLIRSLGDRVIWAFDRDEAGFLATEKAVDEFAPYISSWVFRYPRGKSGKDPGELRLEEVENGIRNAEYALDV